MSGVYTVILIIGALFALIAVVVGAIVVTRSGIVEKTNAMLDNSLRQTRLELAETEVRCREDLNELRSKHDVDLAVLRGRLDAMTPSFAQEIAAALARLGKAVSDA